MKKVLTYSLLLLLGLVLSQLLPGLLGTAAADLAPLVRVLTMIGLAYIMIHVGYEFHIDKSNLRQYGWDYVVAFTAASFPWILVTGYFVFVMLPSELWGLGDTWKETLLAGRFAAPTSAGVLFSMLLAAGMGGTWVFKKARILAIFDDLDTVMLMVPLKILMIGFAWQLGGVVVLMAALLVTAFVWLHRLRLPVTWPWVLLYATVIVGISEAVYFSTKAVDPAVPIHIEVLLPAFVLGCLARPRSMSADAPVANVEAELHRVLERDGERRAATIVSSVFMVLVGLSMPAIFGGSAAETTAATTVTAAQPSISWAAILGHVLVLTLLSNLGKMFPLFCYRREAHWRERLALAIGMWPRGEVGAGVLVLSLSYGIGGPIVTVAMLSLALNLLLTGVFILMVKRLIDGAPSVGRQPSDKLAPVDRSTSSAVRAVPSSVLGTTR